MQDELSLLSTCHITDHEPRIFLSISGWRAISLYVIGSDTMANFYCVYEKLSAYPHEKFQEIYDRRKREIKRTRILQVKIEQIISYFQIEKDVCIIYSLFYQ